MVFCAVYKYLCLSLRSVKSYGKAYGSQEDHCQNLEQLLLDSIGTCTKKSRHEQCLVYYHGSNNALVNID